MPGSVVRLRPRGPYSLALTCVFATDATRRFRDGVFTAVIPGHSGPELAQARQRPDGEVEVLAESEEAVEQLRFVLGLDADHAEFLRRFRDDPLLGPTIAHLRGKRVLRTPTVAGSLLRALCGQLIESNRARQLERTIVRATSEQHGDLWTPPTCASLARLAPARLRALGLHARRGATLVRICSELELERLRHVPVDRAARRLMRERGLGRWSVGVVALQGLGSFRYGLAGDLGLLKLFELLHGRWPEEGEDADLLRPYGEWQGLASVYLLAGSARGLVAPLAQPTAA
jgi:3-methyladenine DNA glycosylase/8-oxoguanine DNA glycosylase